MKADVLIVGQGLAGSLLAWRFLDRSFRILVVDKDEAVTSSKVAAGLITTLTGPRFKIADRFEERLNFAKQFYWDVEEATGTRLFHHLKIARLLATPKEQETWNKRVGENAEAYSPWHNPLSIDERLFHVPHGGVELNGGGWLDVPGFLEATRQRLMERASYAIATVKSEDVQADRQTLRWKNVEADRIIFCEGWLGNRNRFFDWIPMNSSEGCILDLKIPELGREKRIVNKGGWLLPTGDGMFRAGSTYRRVGEDCGDEIRTREEILGKLSRITPVEPEVIGEKSAIRPIIHRSQVFMGTHPMFSRVCFFNGLGSKGVLNGPWHADKFVRHLVDGLSLPDESDIQSNLL